MRDRVERRKRVISRETRENRVVVDALPRGDSIRVRSVIPNTRIPMTNGSEILAVRYARIKRRCIFNITHRQVRGNSRFLLSIVFFFVQLVPFSSFFFPHRYLIFRSIFLPVYWVYICGIYRRNRSVSCRSYLNDISDASVC